MYFEKICRKNDDAATTTRLSILVFCLLIIWSISGVENSFSATLPRTSTHPQIFLTPERLSDMQQKISSNSAIFTEFKRRIDAYPHPANSPYYGLINEYATGNALLYTLTKNETYLNIAKALLFDFYINGSLAGWNYQDRNTFRWFARGAFITYDWIYNDLSASERTQVQNAFKNWLQYWMNHVDYANNFAGHAILDVDSDENTSLTEAFLMLGLCLYGDDNASAELSLDAADAMMNKYVLGMYMNDSMKGGLWAEGSHYSGATEQHWVRAFLLNKETRDIEYPNNYIEESLLAHIHSTFPKYTGFFSYNDIQAANSDYFMPYDHHRYDLMLMLTAMVQNNSTKMVGQDWLNKCVGIGYTSQTINPGVYRMLFETPNAASSLPSSRIFHAEGLGFVAMRDMWGENGTVVYSQNSPWTVDHMHFDALSFDIIRKGVIVTKEVSGYDGPSNDSISHNTLYLETPSSRYYPAGNSSPTRRPIGKGSVNKYISTDFYSYVESEAAPIYNYVDWQGEQRFYDHANRKLVFLHSKYVIVYDYIQQNLNPGVEPYRDRFKKYFQHFETRPTAQNGYHYAASNGQKLFFQTLLPANAAKTVVDESVMYQTAPYTAQQYQVPNEQRKWHIEIAPVSDNRIERFLHVLYFDDTTVSTMPATEYLTVSNKMVGTIIRDNQENKIVYFSSGAPGTPVTTSLNYSIDTTAKSRHFIFDMQPDSRYIITIDDISNVHPDGVISNSDGTVMFESSLTGTHTYSVSIAGSTENHPAPPENIRIFDSESTSISDE